VAVDTRSAIDGGSGSPVQAELDDRRVGIFETAWLEQLGKIPAPNCDVWDSFDDREQTVDDALEVWGHLPKLIEFARSEDARRNPFEGGFMRRHRLGLVRSARRGAQSAPTGEVIGAPCCLVVDVREGQISRIEEFLDRAAIAAVVQRLWD
jgi:ketosteroid isomerase-like protein